MITDAANLESSGGVYIPPFKLARMMKEVQDKSGIEYQGLRWEVLRKSINGLENKVNATNLVSVVNAKFAEVGHLLLIRIVLQLKRAYKWNDKPELLAALELLTVLLLNPTDDSVDVAVGFVTECGSILQVLPSKCLHDWYMWRSLSSSLLFFFCLCACIIIVIRLGDHKGDGSVNLWISLYHPLNGVSPCDILRLCRGTFERFRGILYEGGIDKRVQFLIEGLFAIRKAKFQVTNSNISRQREQSTVRPELDLVDYEDQQTHEISLQGDIDPEITLDIFKPDLQLVENEKLYEQLKKTILGDEFEEEKESEEGSEDASAEEVDAEEAEQMNIKDETETNLVNLRRTIYLTIMSGVDFEEAGHKLLISKLEPGQEMDLYAVGVLQSRKNLPPLLWYDGAAVLHDEQSLSLQF